MEHFVAFVPRIRTEEAMRDGRKRIQFDESRTAPEFFKPTSILDVGGGSYIMEGDGYNRFDGRQGVFTVYADADRGICIIDSNERWRNSTVPARQRVYL